VENLEGKIPLGRSGLRWNDKIKMDLREIGWGGVDWIHLAEDRGPCEHDNKLSGYVNYWRILE
jgi:hypothetical protein